MRKAITPVISVILLIMLVVAITGGAWYWMTNVQGSLQESAGANIEETSDLSSTQFSIVSVVCFDNGTSNQINVTVLNTGVNEISDSLTWVLTVSNITGSVLGVDSTLIDETGAAISSVPSGAAQVAASINNTDIHAGVSYSVKVNIGSSSQTATCTAT